MATNGPSILELDLPIQDLYSIVVQGKFGPVKFERSTKSQSVPSRPLPVENLKNIVVHTRNETLSFVRVMVAPTPAPLLSLPLEILRLIAIYTEMDLLRFVRTCLFVRKAFYHPSFLKQAVHYQLQLENTDTGAEICVHLGSIAKKAGEDMKVWVRYLVALSSLKEAKMKKLCDVANTPKTLKHRVKIGHRLMAFIPQLITIGSSKPAAAIRIGIHHVFSTIKWDVYGDEGRLWTKKTFCFAAAISHTGYVSLVEAPGRKDNLPESQECDEAMQSQSVIAQSAPNSDQMAIMHEVFDSLKTSLIDQLQRQTTYSGMRDWTSTYCVLGIMMEAAHRHHVIIPKLELMLKPRSDISPWQAPDLLPLPFDKRRKSSEGDAFDEWERKRDQQLADLDGEQWCGIASTCLHVRHLKIILDLRFSKKSGYWQVTGEGNDQGRRFAISSINHRGIGFFSYFHIHFDARYGTNGAPHALDSKFRGYMTRFGILGYWNRGSGVELVPNGFFWLWKSVWADQELLAL